MVIGIYDFDIICNLSIVIWDFGAVFWKASRFYLNQLELTSTFPRSTVNMALLIFFNHRKFGIQIFKYNQNISRVGEFFITKVRKHEKDNNKISCFPYFACPVGLADHTGCFRDCFYFLPKKAQNSQFRYSNI